MSMSEIQLDQWSNPPSDTEETRAQHTEQRIRDVIYKKFGEDVEIFKQGSHKNRTNVKLDSDIDLVVKHKHLYYNGITALSGDGLKKYNLDFLSASYSFDEFKSDLHSLLESEFGSVAIERADKCIKVHKNESRVNADIVPAWSHIRFASPYIREAEGIAFKTDKGKIVYGFPDQHYQNGVRKNSDTNRQFKSIVRILKNIRNNIIEPDTTNYIMPSFSLECLVWNVGEEKFNGGNYSAVVNEVVARIWNDMRNEKKAMEYAEVSDLKWLFKGSASKITPKNAEDFMLEVWRHLN